MVEVDTPLKLALPRWIIVLLPVDLERILNTMYTRTVFWRIPLLQAEVFSKTSAGDSHTLDEQHESTAKMHMQNVSHPGLANFYTDQYAKPFKWSSCPSPLIDWTEILLIYKHKISGVSNEKTKNVDGRAEARHT